MKHHIIAIGISKHQDPFVNDLKYAAKDASEFFDLFTKNIGEIGYQRLLIDSEATLSQIRTALGSELQKEAKPDDVFFFFYSGHGTTAGDTDSRSLAHFVLPFDATRDITNSCISVSFLRETFDRLPCKAKLIFVDSCFSGSINSKGYTNPNKKAFKEIKTFANTVTGIGELSFSASKEDEEAIEDPEAQNGLFTYYLLEELQKERDDEKLAILNIFTPITEGVIERAKERYNHVQTPTLNSYLEGNIYLPIFKKRIKLPPQLLDIPKYPELSSAVFPILELQLEDKKQEKLINKMINLIIKGRQSQQGSGQEMVRELVFERFCGKLIKQIEKDWEHIFTENGERVSEIPNSVAKLEIASFQFILLGGVTAVFGSEKQMSIYSQYVTEILKMTRNRAGLVALIAVPEVILAEIVYVVGTLSLAREYLKPFNILLKTKIEDFWQRDDPPQPLIVYKHIHYCDALGGNSIKVNDHIRKILGSFSWMPELAPKLEGKVDNLQCQVNFLLVMLTRHYGDYLWPDFGRWNRWRIMPLINKIKYDNGFREQLGEMFQEKPEEIRELLRKYLKEIKKRGLGNYPWDSTEVSDLLSEQEKQAEEGKGK